jgi:predicted DNA binding CopG/RHH family protein
MQKHKEWPFELDREEKEILKLFEQNKLKRSKSVEKDISVAKEAAAEYVRKSARVTIRLTQFDLDRIKRVAAREGLPYQTLISSMLHKYATRLAQDR